MHVKANGTLERWPKLNEQTQRRTYDGHCHCFSPIPDHIAAFGATQCLKCGKKLGRE